MCDLSSHTGMIVNDILSPWRQSASDPFLLWHEFGPMPCDGMPPIGMHPHRGFNEEPRRNCYTLTSSLLNLISSAKGVQVPYLKKGRWMGVDHWNPEGEDQHPLEANAHSVCSLASLCNVTVCNTCPTRPRSLRIGKALTATLTEFAGWNGSVGQGRQWH